MSERSDNVLSYARPRSRFKSFLSRHVRAIVYLALAAALLPVGVFFIGGPTSGQIRLDTGDLRYCWLGIPVSYKLMPEPERSKLLTLARRKPAVPGKWVTCVTYPLTGSNNPDLMCRHFYWSVAIWSDEDPNIARWALDDVTDYIQFAKWGLPKSDELLDGMMVDWRTGKVAADWRERDEVKFYCAEHGYTPPPAKAGPAPAP